MALNGMLGSGKTCFTQGIARGLGVPSGMHVTSPTFTVMNEYEGRLPLFHVDLYRVKNLFELEEIGLEDVLGRVGVAVIEWADKLPGILPLEHLRVIIDLVDEDVRQLDFVACGAMPIAWMDMVLNKYRG